MAEQASVPKPFDGLADVTPNMRNIVINWLFDVHLRFKMTYPTWCLTVMWLDRAIPHIDPPRKQLQLVAVCCALLAAKYNEVFPPDLKDYMWVADNAFDVDEIVAMEQTVLVALEFNLGAPTVFQFLKQPERNDVYSERYRLAQCLALMSHIPHALAHHTALERAEAVDDIVDHLWAGGIDEEIDCTLIQRTILKDVNEALCLTPGAPACKHMAIMRYFGTSKLGDVPGRLQRSPTGFWTLRS